MQTVRILLIFFVVNAFLWMCRAFCAARMNNLEKKSNFVTDESAFCVLACMEFMVNRHDVTQIDTSG